MERRQLAIIIAGGQGCGKSTLAEKICSSYVDNGKPALYVLPDDEEKLFWDIEEIEYTSYEDLARQLRNHKSGKKKIFAEDAKIFETIRKYFRNGIVAIDDARVYLTSRDEALRRFFMRRRQANDDILFICHGLSEVPPSCSTFITDVILFETTDEFERWTIANKEIYLPFTKRINNIARTKNRYYSERIKLRNITS